MRYETKLKVKRVHFWMWFRFYGWNFSVLYLILYLIKLHSRPTSLLKKRFWHRCFHVNFEKFLRTSFLTEHLQWPFLNIKFVKNGFSRNYEVFFHFTGVNVRKNNTHKTIDRAPINLLLLNKTSQVKRILLLILPVIFRKQPFYRMVIELST